MEMEEGESDFGEVMELPPEVSNMRFTGRSGHTVIITSTPHCSEQFKQTAYEKMCLTNDSGFGDTSSLSHSPFPITTNVQIRRRLLESCTSDWDSSQIASPFFSSPDVNTLSLHVDMDVESETGRHQEKYLNDSPDDINMKEFAENFNSVMKSVSPIETNIEFDRVIGRKMGLEKLDIMTELHIRNVQPVSDVLMQLHPEDLCRMCLVCKTWKVICETYVPANERRLKFLRKRKPPSPTGSEKENFRKKMRLLEQRGITDTGRKLGEVQPIGVLTFDPAPPSPKKDKLRDRFQEVASNLKNDEKLQHCPRCGHPAKILPVQDRGLCQSEVCSFDYCIKCLADFHNAKQCKSLTGKKNRIDATIGSKKSKKNLKRL